MLALRTGDLAIGTGVRFVMRQAWNDKMMIVKAIKAGNFPAFIWYEDR